MAYLLGNITGYEELLDQRVVEEEDENRFTADYYCSRGYGEGVP